MDRIGGIYKTDLSINLQFPSQPQLQPVHLAVISIVIVTRKMQQTMKYQLRNFLLELQAILFSLRRGSVNRDRDIAELSFIWSTCRKREHVGGFVNVAKLPVQLANLLVRNKSDRGRRFPFTNRRQCQRCKSGPALSVDLQTSLAIDDLDHRLNRALFTLLFVGTNDHLDQLVTHHVFVGEVDELDSLELRKYSFRFDQATAFTGR